MVEIIPSSLEAVTVALKFPAESEIWDGIMGIFQFESQTIRLPNYKSMCLTDIVITQEPGGDLSPPPGRTRSANLVVAPVRSVRYEI
ncbi:MAG: hypothetical protein WA364_23970 [Candidatus Nitrosopolaris sp.]